MKIKINVQKFSLHMVKMSVTRKNSLTSLLWMVKEKICEAKIFGMKVAFKWNNKCVQVENTHMANFLESVNQRKNTRQCTRHLCLVFSNSSVFFNTRYKQFSINFSIKFSISFLYLILIHWETIVCLISQREMIFEKNVRNKSCR